MAMYPCLVGGGGSQPVLITKNITQNGTYNASADNADGYSQVKVEVSGGGSTLGEKTISTYGVFNASDDSLDGYSKVTNVTGLENATVSGGVASISDAVAMPCPSVVADIDYNSQGVTGATLAKCGINLCDEDFEKGTLNNTTGLPENDNYNVRMKNYVPIRGGIQVYLYFGLNINLRYYWYDKDKTFISGSTGRNTILTVPADACYFKIRTTNNYGATYNHDISLNYPSTDTSYHAYDGTTYTADFERTIYGGNYDFVSGVLTEDTDSNGDPISPPNVYNLTAQTITTAQGVNNFYSDTGDTAATYYREKLPELERLFYFEGVQSDTVQIPPAISLDEGDSFSEYLSYDTTTKKFTVLKAFSAMVTGWVYQFQNASSYGTGQFVVNDTAKMTYQVPSTSAGSKSGYTSVFDFAVGDTFWAYQNTNNGWPQQFLKVYLLDNVSVSGVVELNDETA